MKLIVVLLNRNLKFSAFQLIDVFFVEVFRCRTKYFYSRNLVLDLGRWNNFFILKFWVVDKITQENANNPDFVKGILNFRKENSILNLIKMITFVRAVENNVLKETYLKILPVFLSYSEVFTIHVAEAHYLIKLIQNHSLFGKEKRLLDEWYWRFDNLMKKCWKSDRKTDNRKEAYYTNRFVAIFGTNFVDTIGYAEIDYFNSFHRYLKLHKLHKYLYFFCNLSYVEIASINEYNIRDFEDKVNIFPMTNGARNAILRKLGELNSRGLRLQKLCERDHYTRLSKVQSALENIKTILRTPVRGSVMLYNESKNLPYLIVESLFIIRAVILENWTTRNENVTECARELIFVLRRAWSCYFFSMKQKIIFNSWKIELLHKLDGHKNSQPTANKQNKYIQQSKWNRYNSYAQPRAPKCTGSTEILAVQKTNVNMMDKKLEEVIQYLEKAILNP